MEIIAQNAPLKKWSERKYKKNKVAFVHKVVKFLSWAAGGELRKMMFFLLRVKKYKFSKLTRESRTLNKIIPCINERVRRKHKHGFVKAFRDSNFSEDEVRYLGLNFSQFLWYSCMDSGERDVAANRTSLELIKPAIKRKKNGVVVPQKNERHIENVRYLNKPIAEIQKSFNEQIVDFENLNNQLPSRNTFYTYRQRLFKHAKRRSDMCDYCVLGNTLKKNIEEFIKVHHNDIFLENFDLVFYIREFGRFMPSEEVPAHLLKDLNQQYVDEILYLEPGSEIPFIDQNEDNYYDPTEINESRPGLENANMNDDLEIDLDEEDSDDADDTSEPNPIEINQQNIFKQLRILRQIEFHRTIANIQRVAYNNSVKVPNEFYDEGITIEMDFKQKIVYGKNLLIILI
jgi:hypothetical protein